MKGLLLPPLLRPAAGLLALGVFAMGLPPSAQAQVFRCPNNEYINNADLARSKGCKAIDNGNLTIVHGDNNYSNNNNASAPAPARANTPAPVRRNNNSAAPPPPASSNPAQRERDTNARRILEAELSKAQQKLSTLKAEYKNGEPDRLGNERNYQKYLDRVAEMKAEISRTENDISGLQREINRIPR